MPPKHEHVMCLSLVFSCAHTTYISFGYSNIDSTLRLQRVWIQDATKQSHGNLELGTARLDVLPLLLLGAHIKST